MASSRQLLGRHLQNGSIYSKQSDLATEAVLEMKEKGMMDTKTHLTAAEDTHSDWTIVSGGVDGGITGVWLTRPLVTGDQQVQRPFCPQLLSPSALQLFFACSHPSHLPPLTPHRTATSSPAATASSGRTARAPRSPTTRAPAVRPPQSSSAPTTRLSPVRALSHTHHTSSPPHLLSAPLTSSPHSSPLLSLVLTITSSSSYSLRRRVDDAVR